MVKTLIAQGYTVKAAHIDYEGGTPDEYGGKVPDIFAYKNGNDKIFVGAEFLSSEIPILGRILISNPFDFANFSILSFSSGRINTPIFPNFLLG